MCAAQIMTPRSPRRTPRCSLAVLITLLMVATHGIAVADEDARFVAGLRERRLFALAETYCNERLTNSQPSEIERIELTVELVRTYAEHALNSRGDSGGPRIRIFVDTIDFLSKHKPLDGECSTHRAADAWDKHGRSVLKQANWMRY